jgi:hypothetical protein
MSEGPEDNGWLAACQGKWLYPFVPCSLFSRYSFEILAIFVANPSTEQSGGRSLLDELHLARGNNVWVRVCPC